MCVSIGSRSSMHLSGVCWCTWVVCLNTCSDEIYIYKRRELQLLVPYCLLLEENAMVLALYIWPERRKKLKGATCILLLLEEKAYWPYIYGRKEYFF